MKKILIILDNSILATSVSSWLNFHHDKEIAKIIFASNILEAIEIFKTEKIDVLVMELTESILEVLFFAIKKTPKTELIMLTNTVSIKNDTLFDFHTIKKPSSFINQKYLLKSLIKNICEGDYLSKPIGNLHIRVFFFLLILVRKHGFVNINNEESDYIYFNQGRLWAAKYKDVEGEQAIFNILEKNVTTISFTNNFSKKDFQRQIFTPFRYLLTKYNNRDIKNIVDKEISTEKEQIKQEKLKQEQIKQEKLKQEQIKQELTKLKKNKKDLTPYLQKLYEIEGYLAMVACDAQGKVIIDNQHKDYKKYFIDFDFISVTKDIKDIIKTTTLKQCDFVQINYEKASICSFCIYNPHLMVNVLLKPDTSIGLVKFIFNKPE